MNVKIHCFETIENYFYTLLFICLTVRLWLLNFVFHCIKFHWLQNSVFISLQNKFIKIISFMLRQYMLLHFITIGAVYRED